MTSYYFPQQPSRAGKAWAFILSVLFIMVCSIVIIHTQLDRLAQKYDTVLSEYLTQALSIKEFDSKMSDIAGVKPCSTGELRFSGNKYLEDSQLDSKYLFLRNDIHVERLSPIDFNLLRLANPNSPTEHKPLLSMIAMTYPTVLNLASPGDSPDAGYGGYSNDMSETVSANTIVLWVDYDYHDEADDNSGTQWKQAHQAIDALIHEYSQKFSEELEQPVQIFIRMLVSPN
jgi:hypothetical protein